MVNPERSSPWRSYLLEEIANIQPGQRSITPNSLLQAHGTIPLIFPGDLNNNKEVTGKIYTTWEQLQEKGMQNQVLTQERLLLTLSGEKVGTVSIIHGAAIHPHTIVAIMPKDLQFVSIEFLFYSLRYQYPAIQERVQDSATLSINSSSLTQLSIPVPSMQTQKQIVKQLDTHLRTTQRLYTLIAEAQQSTERLAHRIQTSMSSPDLHSRQQEHRFTAAHAMIQAMHMQATQSASHVAQAERALLEQAFQGATL